MSDQPEVNTSSFVHFYDISFSNLLPNDHPPGVFKSHNFIQLYDKYSTNSRLDVSLSHLRTRLGALQAGKLVSSLTASSIFIAYRLPASHRTTRPRQFYWALSFSRELRRVIARPPQGKGIFYKLLAFLLTDWLATQGLNKTCQNSHLLSDCVCSWCWIMCYFPRLRARATNSGHCAIMHSPEGRDLSAVLKTGGRIYIHMWELGLGKNWTSRENLWYKRCRKLSDKDT